MKHEIVFLGKISYNETLKLQEREKLNVKNGSSSGKIFFLEHDPPVITTGRNSDFSNLLKTADELKIEGIDLIKASRGGNITAHEPGQLVAYFILPVNSKSSGKFITDIIDKIILFLEKEYGIKSEYNEKNPGIWVNEEKICSTGFDLTGGVSMHGIALNVCNSLDTFKYINPCGISGCSMTKMEKAAGLKFELKDVYLKLRKYFE